MRARVRLVRLLLLVLLAASLVASDAQATEESAQRGTAEGSSNWTREPLRIALEKLLAWNLGADVSIGAIAGPLVPELTLRDVTIDVRGERLATVELFRAKVDAWALFRENAPLIELVTVEGARIELVRSSDGRWNLPDRGAQDETLSEDAGSLIAGIGFGEIALRGSQVRVRDSELALDFDIAFEATDLSLPFDAEARALLRASLALTARPGHFAGEHLEAAELTLSLADGRLDANRALATGSFGRASIRGTLDLRDSLTRPAGRVVVALDSLAGQGRAIDSVHLAVESSGGGALDIEDLRIDVGGLTLAGEGRAQLDDEGALHIEQLVLGVDGQSLEITGTIAAAELSALSVRTRNFDAAALGALLGAPVPLAGRLDAHVTLDGGFPTPAVRADVVWTAPVISRARFDRATLQARTRDATLRIDAMANHAGREILTAWATLPWSPNTPASADLLSLPATRAEFRGDPIDLSLFEPFLSRYARDLRGRAKVRLALHGAVPQPRIEGALEIRRAGVRVPLLQRNFAPIDGRIELDGDGVRFDALRIGTPDDPDAEARLSGRLGLDRLVPASADFTLSMQHFPLARSSLLRTLLDGELTIEGSVSALEIHGDVFLEDSRVRIPESEDPLLREIQVFARSSGDDFDTTIVEGTEEPDEFDRSSIDIRLSAPRGTRVKGRGADVDIEGVLEVKKRPLEAPRFSGSFAVVRGNYTFQGRRFAIRRGTADFDGGSELNPVIDIEAEYRVSDVIIRALLGGRALDPILRLDSEPPLPESEVLHYLVFGRASDTSADGGSSRLDAAAGALAAGVAAAQITPLLEDVLPIDTLEFRVPDDRSEGEFGVGKYVQPGVYIRYGRTLSRDPVDQVNLELQLSDHWSLETEARTDENAGVDLIWSIDF